MKNPREIKKRIGSVKKIQQITKAMKMVSASRYKRAYQIIISNRPYAQALGHLMKDLMSRKDENLSHPLFKAGKKADKELLLIVGSDKGLCGSFNSRLFRYAVKYLAGKQDKTEIIAVGKKTKDFFSRRNYNVIDSKLNWAKDLSFDIAVELAGRLIAGFKKGTYFEVTLLYNEYKNVAQANIKLEKLLPLSDNAPRAKTNGDYLYEPGVEKILNILIPKYLNVIIYKMLIESNASEQGHRMTAMELATKNSDEMIKNLTLTYNKSRQASITRELADLVGGAAAVV